MCWGFFLSLSSNRKIVGCRQQTKKPQPSSLELYRRKDAKGTSDLEETLEEPGQLQDPGQMQGLGITIPWEGAWRSQPPAQG